MLVMYNRLLTTKPVRVGFMVLVALVITFAPYFQLTFAPAQATASSECTEKTLDFNQFSKGDTVQNTTIDEFTFTVQSNGDHDVLMIFDTSNKPFGEDKDLRTDEDRYGPNNSQDRGNALIISENNDTDEPDDEKDGGIIMFESATPVTIKSIGFLDIEETGGKVYVFDESDSLLKTADINKRGDNSYQEVQINAEGVITTGIHLVGSGAITHITYCVPVDDSYCELTLTKTDDGYDPSKPGDEIVYHLTLENTGTADCTGGGVKLRDEFNPNELEYISHILGDDYPSESPFVAESDYLQWNFATVQPGEVREIWTTFAVKESVECDSTVVNKLKAYSAETGWGNYVQEQTTIVCDDPELISLPVASCSGEGTLFAYQDDQFQSLETEFTTQHDELIIFTRDDADFTVAVNGTQVSPTLLASQSFAKAYSVTTATNDVVTIASPSNQDARKIQGYLTQDSSNPVYDLSTFTVVIDDDQENTMYLTPGTYSHLFFDKYTYMDNGSDDSRNLSVTISDINGALVADSYTKPHPNPAEGIVLEEYTIATPGEYTMSVQTEDSIYWAYNTCPGPEFDFDVELKKAVNDMFVSVGETVTFLITVDNVSFVDGTNVSVEDSLPSELHYVANSANPSTGSFDENTMVWTIGDLPSLATETLTFDAIVSEEGSFVNVAQVLTHDQDDIDSTPGVYIPGEDDQDTAEVSAEATGPYCGDGVINQVSEECDDGNTYGGDGCSAQCNLELPGSLRICKYRDVTGDGKTSDDEAYVAEELTSSNTVKLITYVMLEGPYLSADTMNSYLGDTDLLPQSQPFNTSPWYYAGSEETFGTPTDFVDWVLVELRTDVNGVAVARSAGVVRNDGKVFAADRVNPVAFTAEDGDYYIVVTHRNHLGIMSANVVTFSSGTTTEYDFTTGQGTAYGTNPMKDLGNGDFGMISGDGNTDGTITAADRVKVWQPQNGTVWAYTKFGDYNLDGGIDALDLNLKWNPNQNKETQVPMMTHGGGWDMTIAGPNGTSVWQTSFDGCVLASNLPTGSYTVTEADVEFWNVTDLYSNGIQQTPVTASVTVAVNENQETQIDFYNQREQQPFCGDGSVNTQVEQCDDGDQNGELCTPGYGGNCSYCSSSCTVVTLHGPTCGDGIVQVDQGEECDEGSNNGSGTCSTECTIPSIEEFDIELTKTVDNNSVAVATNVTFTITALNNSAINGTGVVVADRLPSAFVLVASSSSATLGSFDESDMTWTIGDLAAGASATLTFDATVVVDGTFENIAEVIAHDQTDIDSTPNNNIVSEDDQDVAAVTAVGGSGGPQCGNGILESGEQCDDGNTANGDGCSAQCTVEETGCTTNCGGSTSRPNIVITKTAGVEFTNPDTVVTYTIEVTNTKQALGRDLVVTDDLPEGIEYASSTMTGTWNLGDIKKNEIKTITYDVYFPETIADGEYINTATASISNGNSDSDDAKVEVRTPSVLSYQPLLVIEKQTDRSFTNPNGEVVYTVVVTNIHVTETAVNTILVDRLPKQFYFAETDSYVRSWNLGDLAPGQSATITYTAKVLGDTPDGDYVNIATASADNASDVHDDATVEVRTVTVQGFTLPDTNGAGMVILYLLSGGLMMLLGLLIKKYREVELYSNF